MADRQELENLCGNSKIIVPAFPDMVRMVYRMQVLIRSAKPPADSTPNSKYC